MISKLSQNTIPFVSSLFPNLSDAQMRRQIVRWFIRDYQEANEHMVTLLRSALDDPDWEVRVSAMLAVARLCAVELGKAVRKVELPRTSREGLDATDRRVLLAIRKAVLALLGGEPVPADLQKEPETEQEMLSHLMRCVAGEPTQWHERIFLLIHALTCPVETRVLPPNKLPAGVIALDGIYRLAKTGIELVWVPPVPHWLGTHELPDAEPTVIPNPIRQVVPQAGFFIAKHPVTAAIFRRAPSLREQAGYGTTVDGYWTTRWQGAQHLCGALSRLEEAQVTLPNVEQWEMAARGPDGRRYPWGNGYEKDALEKDSPWGCVDTVGVVGQWTSTLAASMKPVVCGQAKGLLCTVHGAASSSSEQFAVRPVVGASTAAD